MTRLVLALCAILAVCAAPASAQTAEDPAAVAARLAASPPSHLDDYFALKEKLGREGLGAVRNAATQLAFEQLGMKIEPGRGYPACMFPAWHHRVSAGLNLAYAIPDRAAWQVVRGQIEDAMVGRDRTFEQLMAGGAPDPAYAAIARAVKEASEAAHPRARELARRVAKDQFARMSISVIETRQLWASNVDAAARQYLLGGAACAEDRENTEWLKKDLRENGWPKISQFGPVADRQAWLLVQHADQDVAFQREVLGLLEGLVAAKETSPRNYGMLWDRVATAENRLQRYGTQGRCVGPGKWTAYEVEDPANLEARRASLGFPTMAEYATGFTQVCAGATEN